MRLERPAAKRMALLCCKAVGTDIFFCQLKMTAVKSLKAWYAIPVYAPAGIMAWV
jgi:hypothetical protein